MIFNRLPPKVIDSATIMMMLSTTGKILQQGEVLGRGQTGKASLTM